MAADQRAPAGASASAAAETARARAVLEAIPDPEIPVLTLGDLGLVRSVGFDTDGVLAVGIAPTYSGCPATHYIREEATRALAAAGFANLRVRDVLSPPWSSDWISAEGRRKLHEYGIAPPAGPVASMKRLLAGDLPVACPRCASTDTEKLSEFGSTPCKALHRCRACLEPFDSFKCI